MADNVRIFNYSVYSGALPKLPVAKKTFINTLNQNAFCVAEYDKEFKESLQKSDILLPDGISIVIAVKVLAHEKITKVAGADIHAHLLNQLNEIGGSCFYLGASESTLSKIEERIAKECPRIKVQSYSPPYKPQFSDSDSRQMVDAVNAFKPDVLFVGMTAPKQEKWAYKYLEQLDAKVIVCIGAVFDFYAGTIKRPSQFWINLGLEWFVRLVKEPKRMWRRYIYYGPVFIKFILKEKFTRASSTTK